eukprot:254239_1
MRLAPGAFGVRKGVLSPHLSTPVVSMSAPACSTENTASCSSDPLAKRRSAHADIFLDLDMLSTRSAGPFRGVFDDGRAQRRFPVGGYDSGSDISSPPHTIGAHQFADHYIRRRRRASGDRSQHWRFRAYKHAPHARQSKDVRRGPRSCERESKSQSHRVIHRQSRSQRNERRADVVSLWESSNKTRSEGLPNHERSSKRTSSWLHSPPVPDEHTCIWSPQTVSDSEASIETTESNEAFLDMIDMAVRDNFRPSRPIQRRPLRKEPRKNLRPATLPPAPPVPVEPVPPSKENLNPNVRINQPSVHIKTPKLLLPQKTAYSPVLQTASSESPSRCSLPEKTCMSTSSHMAMAMHDRCNMISHCPPSGPLAITHTPAHHTQSEIVRALLPLGVPRGPPPPLASPQTPLWSPSLRRRINNPDVSVLLHGVSKIIWLHVSDTNEKGISQKPTRSPFVQIFSYHRGPCPTLSEIHRFVRQLYDRSTPSAECITIALIFLHRLLQCSRDVHVGARNWVALTFTACLLAQKVWDDESWINEHFGEFSPVFDQQQINSMEVAFLSGMNWDCSVQRDDYTTYFAVLCSLGRTYTPTPVEKKRARTLTL